MTILSQTPHSFNTLRVISLDPVVLSNIKPQGYSKVLWQLDGQSIRQT